MVVSVEGKTRAGKLQLHLSGAVLSIRGLYLVKMRIALFSRVLMVERTYRSCITANFERREATHIDLVIQHFERFWLRSGTTNEVVLLRCF